MGAGVGKLLPYLVVGQEDKEDNLKKMKVDRILTSGSLPRNPKLVWKQLLLSKDNVQLSMQNLLEGAQFIQKSRIDKKNTFVVIQEKDPDSVVFATAYLMAISGLSPEASSLAISRVLKDGEYTFSGRYDPALRALRATYNPKELRTAVVKEAGDYPSSQLTEDVYKIYDMAGLIKPTTEQINLEVKIDETKRMSLAGGETNAKDDKRKGSADVGAEDPALMKKATGILSKEMETSKKTESNGSVTAGLKKMISGSSSKDDYEQPMSKEMVDSLMAVKNEKDKVDLPEILSKVKKRGEIYPILSYYIKPDPEFDEYSLTGITPLTAEDDIRSKIPFQPDSAKDTQPPLTPEPDEMKKDTENKLDDASKKLQPKDHSKAGSLYDKFLHRLGEDIEFDYDAYTDVGMFSNKKHELESPETPTKREETGRSPSTPNQVSGSADSTNSDFGERKYNIIIIRAYSSQTVNSTAHVDEYLASLTDEEREKNRRNVIISRAYSRDAYRVQE